MRSDKFSQIHQGSINIFKDSRGVSESIFFSFSFGHDVSSTRNMGVNNLF